MLVVAYKSLYHTVYLGMLPVIKTMASGVQFNAVNAT